MVPVVPAVAANALTLTGALIVTEPVEVVPPAVNVRPPLVPVIAALMAMLLAAVIVSVAAVFQVIVAPVSTVMLPVAPPVVPSVVRTTFVSWATSSFCMVALLIVALLPVGVTVNGPVPVALTLLSKLALPFTTSRSSGSSNHVPAWPVGDCAPA